MSGASDTPATPDPTLDGLDATQRYLRERFGAYYGQADIALPAPSHAREIGAIRFGEGMRRHESTRRLGPIADALRRDPPRHAYYSAARYERPPAQPMPQKGRQGTDLVFDIDADHVPGVDGDDPLRRQLGIAKHETRKLLAILCEDLGVDVASATTGPDADVAIVFSGGRGFHVHVRTERWRGLDDDAREELVDHITGAVGFDALVDTTTVTGTSGTQGATVRELAIDGGWGRRVHDRLCEIVDTVQAMTADDGVLDASDAVEYLQGFDGIGERRAETLCTVLTEHTAALHEGVIDVHPAVPPLVRALVDEVTTDAAPTVDRPVTTDLHRLVRLPGSLHGGTGLRVTPLTYTALRDFDPFVDAVPAVFDGQRTVKVVATDDGVGAHVRLADFDVELTDGPQIVPECVGIHLCARGLARIHPDSEVPTA